MGRPRQGGLAMVEVLVSILVFSFGVLGLVGLQARAIEVSVDAEDRNRAALLANELVTHMWLQKTASLPDTTLTPWKIRLQSPSSGGLPGGAATITVDGRGKQADIKITWNAPHRAAAPPSTLTTRVVLP